MSVRDPQARTADARRQDRQSTKRPERPERPERAEESVLTLISYDEESFDERELEDPSELSAALEEPGVHWLNLAGLDEELTRKVADVIGLHPVTIDDVIAVGQRPKVEEHQDYLFMVMRMLMVRNVAVPPSAATSEDDTFNELKAKVALKRVTDRSRRRRTEDRKDADNGAPLNAEALKGDADNPNRLHSEQFAMVLQERLVVTFQENVDDPFGSLRQRLEEGHGQIRSRGADFLAYTMIDLVIDQYFTVVESYGDNLEALEDEILLRPSREAFAHVNSLRRDLIHLRRSIWPLRDVMSKLEEPDTPFFAKETAAYMRDAHNHVLQVIETLEVLREMVTGLHDLYLTALNTRMNDIIKVLTVISTIFIPLTFLAGIYGMNFENQPEYAWRWAYPALLGLMAVLTVVMLWLFRRKGWV